jgi:hypothetical protein
MSLMRVTRRNMTDCAFFLLPVMPFIPIRLTRLFGRSVAHPNAKTPSENAEGNDN